MDPSLIVIAKRTSFQNWSRTFRCSPEYYFSVHSEDQIIKILELARNNGKRVKVIGSGHSPSDLACTDGYMINTDKLNAVLNINIEEKTITVQGGIRLYQLHEILAKHGLALSNLGSISEQSIAGVISTATHGTGINFPSLSSMVLELTLLTADGSRITCSRKENQDIFCSALCGLGCIGIITEVKLQCEPAFRLEVQETPEKLDHVLDNLDSIVQSDEHVRFWWFCHTNNVVLWRANRTDKPKTNKLTSWYKSRFLGFHLYQFLLYVSRFRPSLIPFISQQHFSMQFTQPANVIDDSYKAFNFDCLFPQYVNEWAIPYEKTAQALRQLRNAINENGYMVHFPVEVRFVREEHDVWLSPAYGRPTCYIGIIMYRPYGTPVPYKKYWKIFEEIMYSLGGRPHWAKAHKQTPEQLSASYPKFQEFCKVRNRLDPKGMFLNDYLERHLIGDKYTIKSKL
ncbi:uncharacterized protein VTP21DRAFT_5898 [Calcarisporiella thermophila]|uniref:uncharacterized protein n=1 Tax=Calcarisporiella thermophila TaxID=911321 RepID=UPI00374498BC